MKKLSYYCFDLDDNLLKMPTLIKMEALVDNAWQPVFITTAQFSNVRKDFDNWKLGDNAFAEFSDTGIRGDYALINDLGIAIGGSKYPTNPISIASKSWNKFIEAILDGSIISIITARGHSQKTLRNGIEWIIDNYFTYNEHEIIYNNSVKFYDLCHTCQDFDTTTLSFGLGESIAKSKYVSNWLDSCGFYAVSNPNFINDNPGTKIDSPEYGKEIALKDFVFKCAQYSKKVNIPFEAGMSDDDIGNVLHIKTVLSELIKMYPNSKFTLFDTSNGGYVKTIIEN
jgi:hypothetical protein